MKKEIKIGEYIRNRSGLIVKVNEIQDYSEDDDIWYEEEMLKGAWKSMVVKHSPNLIDLIQVGDMVHTKDVLNEDWYWMFDEEMVKVTKETIEQGIDLVEIVTKEMMESISYKVERKD